MDFHYHLKAGLELIAHQQSKRGCGERQLKALDSYFSKLQLDKARQHNSCISSNDSQATPDRRGRWMDSPSQFTSKTRENINIVDDFRAKTGLDSLEDYFSQLNAGMDIKKSNSSNSNEKATERNQVRISNSSFKEYKEKEDLAEPISYSCIESVNNQPDPLLFGENNIQGIQTDDETSDLYLVSLLAAVNIAVFLFEIASPIRNSNLEPLSLPLIYGAKINKLILLGEWWRLLTPMFLHSGFLHVALGCWALLTFGPQVCRGYGPFTFFLIYILGGICGNLTSFIHTPELTVCGTGPVFALIGAWLVYQFQNKEVSPKEVSENNFWKAIIATVLSFILSSFGRVDNWTHLGAAIAGLIFGYLTCPSLELDNASSKTGQKEGVALVHRRADPCKSLAIFTVSMLLLTSLILVYAPEVEILEWD